MQNTANLARRMSRSSRQSNITKPVEITEIVDGARCTAAYIAELTGELATLASGARFSSLAELLSKAQTEAEIWSRYA
jgi:hypothetical protein